ncbi:hypothetical protein BJY04DRAFT_188567 [Aspergillus karnatakaensis]|uniref:Zn(II)2Cys6 transcription factor n=1 Tax=Aspergillus karnatakaensis TaxID=1810916 RepID=UPI003CCD5DC7
MALAPLRLPEAPGSTDLHHREHLSNTLTQLLLTMRPTLRRSCAACAKHKLSCDLRTPRCSRCLKRQVLCVYANEPLTAPQGPQTGSAGSTSHTAATLNTRRFASLDPFDSYPPTRLPRDHVQRLIYSFLHKIAFQYYPLDLNAKTNPFLVSWWPLALGDPALFHVSLQTACLDEELMARKGFHASEILMADSVALLRRKVEDPALAVQDGTMNSVITLAAIEFGKGNVKVSQMHVNGVKKLVDLRGGINAVHQTSPLTARMISWVSLLVMGQPQFSTQDDVGIGDGIPLVPEWQLYRTPSATPNTSSLLTTLEQITDFEVQNVFTRLHNAFSRAKQIPFPSTRLHDLTCFVIHRLLATAPDPALPSPSPITECIRYGMILYMFITHGPTYYSHAVIMNTLTSQLLANLTALDSTPRFYESLDVWLLAIGLVASKSTPQYKLFKQRAELVASSLNLESWTDTLGHIKSILWMEYAQGHDIFRPHWAAIFSPDSDCQHSMFTETDTDGPLLPLIPNLEYLQLGGDSGPSTGVRAYSHGL